LCGLALSPSGQLLASVGPDKMVRVWDTGNGQLTQELAGHTDLTLCVAFSPDGNLLASGSWDGTVRLWDLATAHCLHQLKTNAERVLSVTFSPAGKTLASGGIHTEHNVLGGNGYRYSQPAPIQLWDVARGAETATLAVSGTHIAFSPDGRTLLAGGSFNLFGDYLKGRGGVMLGEIALLNETRIYWYDLGLKREVRRLEGQGGAIALSPTGRWLASATSGHTQSYHPTRVGGSEFGVRPEPTQGLRLWDSLTCKELLAGEHKEAYAVQFSPDGKTVAWIDPRGVVRLWDLTPENALANHPRGFSSKELEALWQDLLTEDGRAAFQAAGTLAADFKGTVAFLKEKLEPAPNVEEKRLTQLIADLNDDQFAVRESAMRELKKLNVLAETALLKALANKLPPEVQKRVEEVLKALGEEPPPEELRCLWAIEVLERIGSPEARQVLETLGQGTPLARQTVQARLALERWKK
jgi:WD40 repeat protein